MRHPKSRETISRAAAIFASLETLFALMKTQSVMDAICADLEEVMRQSAKQANEGKSLTPEEQRVADAMPPKLAAMMRKEFG